MKAPMMERGEMDAATIPKYDTKKQGGCTNEIMLENDSTDS
jgi:hypothetical protein